ncbi:MAG: outer membrane protein OmpA-like peptidoglycan-associated protein [Moritella sp.]|jgi:outer membrane protein OmpA-like peptidoglycan-associated protein
MKKSKLAKALLLTSITLTSVTANAATQEPLSTWKKTGVLSSTIIVGTLVGGPVGLVLGLAAGDWINNTWDKSLESKQLVMENQLITDNLVISEIQNNQLQSDVLALDQQIQQISETELLNKQLVQQALQLDLLFAVNRSELDLTNQTRLAQIANYLAKNPTIKIMLSGHTDPSGKEELNDNLAQQRAFSVQDKLIALGVDVNNISVQSFGAAQAISRLGDVAQYPLDRKVSVEFVDSFSDQKSGSTSDSLAMQF